MTSDHNRIITPQSDPGRWLPDEVAMYEAGVCSWQVEYGMRPLPRYCGQPSRPGASFGYCAEHEAELLECHYLDGTPKPAHVIAAEQEAER
jgi:hypothetical protein